MIALMLDLENISLLPSGVVLSIGYCAANLDTGEYLIEPGEIHLDPQEQLDAGRTVLASTVAWWTAQSEAARVSAFGAQTRWSPDKAVHYIRNMVHQLRDDARDDALFTVWAKPSHMDIPQLKSLLGDTEPWKHWQVRDLFTLAATLDPEGVLKPPPNAAAHVAKADAHWQMEYLLALWRHRAATVMFPQNHELS